MAISRLIDIFLKKAEFVDNDGFQNVVTKADFIIKKQLSENYDYYSREYFGGQDFEIQVVNGDPKTSTIYISTSPSVQDAQNVNANTNALYLELDLSDKISNLGCLVKVQK